MSKVRRIANSNRTFQTITDAQDQLSAVWKKVDSPSVGYNQRVILLQSDTGTGKDESTLQMAETRDVFALQPHDNLSQQMNQRATERGLTTMHLKSRTAGAGKLEGKTEKERLDLFNTDNSIQCLYPERCDALIKRVGSCREVLCNKYDCPVYGTCRRNRYLSQFRKCATVQYVNYSWQKFLTDPVATGVLNKVLNSYKVMQKEQPMFVLGEVGAMELINSHFVSIEEIARGIDIWKDEPLGKFFSLLESICGLSIDPVERAERIYTQWTNIDLIQASKQLSKILIEDTALSLSKAVATKQYSIDTTTEIAKLPRLYQQGWTLIDRLEHMFTHASIPVVFFDGQSIEFNTLPQLSKLVDKVVMQSATANMGQVRNVLKAVTPEISFVSNSYERVRHHTGTRIFKVRTGRYVRQTVFEYDDDWKIVGLRDEIRPHLKRILSILQATPGAKHVNTYKPIYDGKALQEDELIQELRVLKDTTWSNWKSSYGRDLGGVALIEFGTNELSTEVLKTECQKIYQADSIPLDFSFTRTYKSDTHEYANVRTYNDSRVQEQYEQMVSMAQYQVVNRNRPVRNPARTIVYSNHPCPLIDDRVIWVEPHQLKGNLLTLEIKGDYGRILELAKEGMTNTEIAKIIGVHRTTVGRELKKMGFSK